VTHGRFRISPDPALIDPLFFPYLEGMEVHFTPEEEAQLSRMAVRAGTDAPHLVKDAALRLIDEEARFLAAVEKGIAAAERGEFIEEDEMDARIERLFKP
jgi:predicted transcriptional regulator